MPEKASANDLTLLSFSLSPADWSVGMTISPYLIGILALIFMVGVFVRKYVFGRLPKHSWDLDTAEIGIGDQKFSFKPNYTDRQIGYAIWVELSTRKIGLEIDFDNDVIAEVYNSWYEYFSVTRELIKGVSVSQIETESTRTIINLSIGILNNGLRPHLTKWQARYRRWYENELKKHDSDPTTTVVDLQEIQKTFPFYDELKLDMERVNKGLIAYRKKMQQLVFRE